jgi:3-oxoacyl-[acyl-carrier-protein] synthase II
MTAVWITGADQVSSLGQGLEALALSLDAARGTAQAFSFDLPGPGLISAPLCQVQSELPTVAPSKVPMDRNTAMALQVAQGAFKAAGLEHEDIDRDRLGVFWGSGMGGAWTFDQTCRTLYGEQKRIRPTAVVSTMPNAAVAEISLMTKAHGMTQTYACACASSAVALGEALMALRAGRIDVAIVGGSEAMLSPGVVASWHAMRVLASVGEDAAMACKPFDAKRSGFALGEGAAAFILESEAHARRRKAQRLVGLSGYGTSTDAVHMTNPDPAGQVKAMRMALADAGLQTQDIAYINAHGTATTAGDLAECASIAQVFGEHAVPVSSTKAMHGHLLGAGGALELLITMQALVRQKLPLAVNLQEMDPQCGLNLVRSEQAPQKPMRHAMSNSFAFGGTNAVLIVSL